MNLASLLKLTLGAMLLGAIGWSSWWLQRGRPGAALAGVLLVAFVHAPLMAVEFILARRINRTDPAPLATAGDLLRAWVGEVLGACVVFGWHMPFRADRFPDCPRGVGGRRGLVLVHGLVCNRGFWNPWWPALNELGVPCIAVDLRPPFGSIASYATLLDRAVQRLCETTGRPPLIVAHSMGGLAVRVWLQECDADARVHRVVTIGTPHRGTWLARFGISRNAREMRLGATWLAALAAREGPRRYRRFSCFYGHCDNIVMPCSSATLPGAHNHHLRATAHVQLVRHPAVFAEVLRQLDE